MSITTNVKNAVVDAKPFYAYLGMTDLAVEKVREAGAKFNETATKNRAELADLPASAKDAATKLVDQAKEAPALALNKTLEAASQFSENYEELVVRGHKLFERISSQKATKDLVEQYKATVKLSENTYETALKAVTDVERSAKAAFTTGRKEAVKAAEEITESITGDAKEVVTDVKQAAKRTRTATRRTATTVKHSAEKTGAAAKATVTSARKTAVASTTAAERAAKKVGA